MLTNTQTCTNNSVYQFALRERWCNKAQPGLESFLGICAIIVHEHFNLEDTWPILGGGANGGTAFQSDSFLDRVLKPTLILS